MFLFSGQTARVHTTPGNNKIPAGAKTNNLLTDERVRKRYFDELKAIDCFSSEDDNYPEGPPPPLSKKQRRHLGSIQGSLSCDIKPVQSTLTQNIYNQPVVVDNKLDKTLEEEPSRSKISGPSGEGSCSKQAADGLPRKAGDSKRFSEDFKPCIDVLSRVSGSKNVYEVNEETFKLMLSRHRTSKREGKHVPESDPKDTCLEDIGQRVRMCSLNKRPPPPKIIESPKKNKVTSKQIFVSCKLVISTIYVSLWRVQAAVRTSKNRKRSYQRKSCEQRSQFQQLQNWLKLRT